jgi:hypothetical protein
MAQKKKLKYKMMVWDWKDVPDIMDIQNAARKGFTFFYDIETGGDCYCWIASKTPLRKTQLATISQIEFFD